MNSHKENKNAAKALKKSHKNSKKYQQRSSSNDVNLKNLKNVTVSVASKAATTSLPINAAQSGGSTKITGQTAGIPDGRTSSCSSNSSSNTNGSLLIHSTTCMNAAYSDESGGPVAPKFERSNSFSFRLGKISKLFNSITGSKENLSKIENEPFKFTRSRSMIIPGRLNRRSLIEPQLEQLSEEAEKSGDLTSPASPRKNSTETTTPPPLWPNAPTPITANVTTQTPNSLIRLETVNAAAEDYHKPCSRKYSQRPLCSKPLEVVEGHRKLPSTTSLSEHAAVYNPQLNFQKRRSSTLIASFKSTLSGIASGALSVEKKREKLNPKWSASLQSLQAIDNMVSYENMSFIDYDKFNGYEKQLEKQLSSLSLTQSVAATSTGDAISLAAPLTPTPTSQTSLSVTGVGNVPTSAPPLLQTVVRRRKPHSVHNSLNGVGGSQRSSFTFDTDYEHNLDKPKNVYRYSLDSRKLELLNEVSRSSFVWDKHIVDVLNLEDGCVGKRGRRAQRPHGRRNVTDAVDGVVQLKSKSLTHLDGLDSLFACRHSTATTGAAISSSEYFSVSFCNENGYLEEEFLPATKGVTLSSALSELLKRRNLNFSEITITDNNLHGFLEAGGPSSHASSLDENTEVDHLAGHHLIIAERDGSRKTLQKAASFGSRTRPPRLLSSVSTEETTEPGDQRTVPGKQLKQRWSGLFGIKNPHQNQLCELLNGYAKVGVPQQKTALSFDHPQFDGAQEYLDNMHKSWKDFVQHEEMSDGETKIQTAIWELVTTEVYYIHALQTVTDLFLACLEAVQGERLLTDVDQNRLFSNVRDICEANLKFWTLYLYPMVANSVATHEPLRIEYFQPGFITFATTFAPYKKYCAEQSTCQFYCKELNRTNALFTSYLAWCESQKMCNRLRLADILVRPMQRLTKYSLLLAAIKKNMTDDDDIEAMDTMIHTVENFVCSVNNHLTTRQETERLKGVMARIECYDVVDTNNELLEKMVKQHSHMFDLCAPMKGCANHQVRHLFMEGDHKFKDPLGKADVHCFLLTDILLVCKSIAKKGLGALKVIRQPYLTDRLMVHHNSNSNTLNCVYLNEFQVAVTAFTLQCSEAKNWYETLKRTKIIYTRLKQGGGSNWEGYRFGGIGAGTVDSLGVKKSPLNSSIGSRVTSANNSHSGSVEWNDSRNISVDFEKTNSLSSDEGCSLLGGTHHPLKLKSKVTSPQKLSVITSSANTLSVQPLNLLGQSLPNLNLHHSQTNNTLLVPGTTSSHSGNLLLCPSHRGISYPPPSPTRVPLRRGMAFSASIKNPPLVKTRNITSQNSINWHQIPSTPTPTSPQTVESGSLPRAPPLAGGSAGSTHPHPLIDTSHSVGSILQKQPQLQPATSGTTPSNETDV